jgi:Prealbumin-like fold domain
VNIQNCGNVIIRKVTVPSPDPTDTTFDYTTTGGLDPSTFGLKNGEFQDYGGLVLAGSYSVTESDPGPNFMLTGLDCSASDTSHGTMITPDTATGTVSFDLKPLDTVDCTYTNTLQLGAVKIHKTTTKGDAPLAGAEFDVRRASDNSLVEHVTTDANGDACVANLVFGDYTVTETAAPPGYQINDSTTHTVTVDSVATCTTGDPETISFSDTPLSEIQIQFRSLAGPGVTNASIVCENPPGTAVNPVSENGAADPAFDDTDETFTDLAPGTYDCTVVVDP